MFKIIFWGSDNVILCDCSMDKANVRRQSAQFVRGTEGCLVNPKKPLSLVQTFKNDIFYRKNNIYSTNFK